MTFKSHIFAGLFFRGFMPYPFSQLSNSVGSRGCKECRGELIDMVGKPREMTSWLATDS